MSKAVPLRAAVDDDADVRVALLDWARRQASTSRRLDRERSFCARYWITGRTGVVFMLKLAVAAIVALFGLLGARPCLAQDRPAINEIKALAEEAYLYGFPMTDRDLRRRPRMPTVLDPAARRRDGEYSYPCLN